MRIWVCSSFSTEATCGWLLDLDYRVPYILGLKQGIFLFEPWRTSLLAWLDWRFRLLVPGLSKDLRGDVITKISRHFELPHLCCQAHNLKLYYIQYTFSSSSTLSTKQHSIYNGCRWRQCKPCKYNQSIEWCNEWTMNEQRKEGRERHERFSRTGWYTVAHPILAQCEKNSNCFWFRWFACVSTLSPTFNPYMSTRRSLMSWSGSMIVFLWGEASDCRVHTSRIFVKDPMPRLAVLVSIACCCSLMPLSSVVLSITHTLTPPFV